MKKSNVFILLIMILLGIQSCSLYSVYKFHPIQDQSIIDDYIGDWRTTNFIFGYVDRPYNEQPDNTFYSDISFWFELERANFKNRFPVYDYDLQVDSILISTDTVSFETKIHGLYNMVYGDTVGMIANNYYTIEFLDSATANLEYDYIKNNFKRDTLLIDFSKNGIERNREFKRYESIDALKADFFLPVKIRKVIDASVNIPKNVKNIKLTLKGRIVDRFHQRDIKPVIYEKDLVLKKSHTWSIGD